ncbi:MAG: histidine phosphatase family protein [bacterium]|nr:histidine phosphatase family protein [bacterium]
MRKKIYFVRHGESEGNVKPIWQGSDSPLTEKGRAQAVFTAHRCAKFPVEVVLSSALRRARETAEIIVAKTGAPLEVLDLFVERRRPKEQAGRPKDDPEAVRSEREIWANFHVSGFRFSDEENFDDLKERAGRALKFLGGRPEDNILVVTHGFFMRVLAARAIFGDGLTSHECERFIRTFHMENTGITIFSFDKEREDSPWRLWVWNDHAHLG